jgi:hypothetical protein
MINNKDRDETHRMLFDLAFAKRPAEELYDMNKDPEQLRNVAQDPAYQKTKEALARQLTAELRESNDPRVIGDGDRFDQYPYYGGSPMKPGFKP